MQSGSGDDGTVQVFPPETCQLESWRPQIQHEASTLQASQLTNRGSLCARTPRSWVSPSP